MKAVTIITFALSLVLSPACKKGKEDGGEGTQTEETETEGKPTEEAQPTEGTETAEETEEAPAEEPTAVANLESASGSDASGTVTFTETDGKVQISADLEGLKPGKHGFHVHEKGDCSAPDAKSAGGHFNPEGVEHGAPTDEVHHAGDLGNIEVAEDGTAKVELTSEDLTVAEGDHSVVGKAVIVHGGADDLESQPSGAAGTRVACGVAELQK